MVVTNCPTPEVLREFLLGKLSGEECESLCEHFESCSECAKAARTIAADDTISGAMQSAETVVGKKPDEFVEQLILKVLAQRPADSSEAKAETKPKSSKPKVDLSFLSPAQSEDELGRLGEYRILRVLGVGGMGVVFEAEDPHLERRVAIKAIKLGNDESACERFLREARATAALEHDNIVTIFQVGEDDGTPYLAMQFLQGESLQERLNRGKKLPPAFCLKIIREAAAGLSCAHERDLFHRDIKPDNLWLESPNDRVKVVDFGLARFDKEESNLTEAGTILGTPNYMSPEQVRGETLDGRSDLWSLGVVLYQCLTGQQPFVGQHITATLMNIGAKNPTLPHELAPSVPQAVSELVMRLLEKDRDTRIATAEELISLIDALEMPVAHGTQTASRLTGQQSEPEATEALNVLNMTDAIHPSSAMVDEPTVKLAAGMLQNEPSKAKSKAGWKIGLAIALAGVLLAGIVFSLQTKDGTITVNVSEPGVKVFVDEKERIVLESDKTGKIEIGAGEHRLIVKRGDEELYAETFTLKSGGEKLIEAKWTPGGSSVAKNEKPGVKPNFKFAGPNPLDELKASDIPESERFDWQPPELVAVIGEHRGRHWIPGYTTITDVAVSPDGETVASCDGMGRIHLWEAATLKELDAANVVSNCFSIAFSPGGDKLAVSSSNGGVITLFAVEGQSLKKIAEVQGHSENDRFVRVYAIQFTPDGKSLISAGADKMIRIWDVTGEKPVEKTSLTGHTDVLLCLAVSVDGKYLASGGYDKTIRLWDLEPIPKLNRVMEAHTDNVSSIAFSHDNQSLASSSNDKTIRLWDLSSPESEPEILTKEWARVNLNEGGLAFSPNAEMLAVSGMNSADNSRMGLFDLTRSPPTLTSFFKCLDLGFTALDFSNDGKRIYAAGNLGRVASWDVSGRSPKELLGHGRPERSLAHIALSPNNQMVATITREKIRLWDMSEFPEGEPQQLKDAWAEAAFSPDGRFLVTGNSTSLHPLVWDLAGDELRSVELPSSGGNSSGRFVFFPDGKTLAHLGLREVNFWNFSGETPQLTGTIGEGLRDLVVSDDGKRLATTSSTKEPIQIWKMIDGSPKAEVALDKFQQPIAFTSDNETLTTASSSSGIYDWDLGVQPPLMTKRLGTSDVPDESVVSPTNGNTYIALRHGKVLELNGGVSREMFQAPGPISELAISSDGRYLVTANSNGTAYILRLDNKK